MKSARIKRRNKQGFLGLGNYHGVGANHEYENINNPIFTHKEQDKNREQEWIINRAKKFGCKHPGSKTLKQLKHLYA